MTEFINKSMLNSKEKIAQIMNDFCEVHSWYADTDSMGVPVRRTYLKYHSPCLFSTIRQDERIFSYKVSGKQVFLVSLPSTVEIFSSDLIKYKGEFYNIIGIRENSFDLKKDCEVVRDE